MLNNLEEIQDLIERKAMFYISLSGGKDGQVMYNLMRDIVPHDQITVIHADLGVIEWEGVQDHIRNTINHELNIVRATKSFFRMVLTRYLKRPDVPCWPSPGTRQCTSDLKRGPIYKFIRNHMKDNGLTLAVNCTGIRAQESSGRAKQKTFELNNSLTHTFKDGSIREVYELKPVHKMTTLQVFATIADYGQAPFWAYEKNDRLSCVFCIMGCEGDLKHGALHRPDLYEIYVHLERFTGYTMFFKKSLEQVVGIPVKQLPKEEINRLIDKILIEG